MKKEVVSNYSGIDDSDKVIQEFYKENRKTSLRTKIFSFILTIGIMGFLIIAGPANAFILGLTILDDEVDHGDKVSFIANIDIETGERLPIENLSLEIKGPNDKTCFFNPDASIINDCPWLKIVRIMTTDYGYGYGYAYYRGENYSFGYGYGYETGEAGEGKLVYNITLDTAYFLPGNYTGKIIVRMDNTEFSSDEREFTILGIPFKIRLNKKWNLISVPFMLLDNKVESVFQNNENIESVWSYDSEHNTCAKDWCVYRPDSLETSDLQEVEVGRGYWINSREDAELYVIGSLYNVPEIVPPAIKLVQGWNLVGYYGTDNMSEYNGPDGNGKHSYCSLYSLRNLEGWLHPTKWSALVTYWEKDNPNQWKELSLCSKMDPGAGYWLKMDEEGNYAPQTVCPAELVDELC